MFLGQKLTRIRELNGLTRNELAQKLSITEQIVWQYENQSLLPRLDVFKKMTSLFGITPKYFFTDEHKENAINESTIAFRIKDRNSRKISKYELTYLNTVNDYIVMLEQYLSVPKPSIQELQQQAVQIMKREQNNERTVSMVAELARRALELTTNKELMYKLELSGIYIVQKQAGSSVDTYSGWTKDNRPFIIVGKSNKSAAQRNFDLAHELGHLLLHARCELDALSDNEYEEIEKQADLFAMDFLIPSHEFKGDFSHVRYVSNPDDYVCLKRKYLVPIALLEKRAYQLKLLSYWESRSFFATFSKKGYWSFEPLDGEIHPIKPGKIRSLFEVLLGENVIDMQSFLSANHITLGLISRLFNLPEKFFNQYNLHENSYYNNSKIVSIDSYRAN
ncbi:spr1629 family repressor/antitoxin [Lentilactobacillus otakiensis]|uniref:spr1629 family repressor/antitoxin n=1 Tax=Lentilactobacillus otakiensis TaxID=481720 RepID=UPI003D171D98